MAFTAEQSKGFAPIAPVPGEVYVLTDPTKVLDQIVAIVIGATVDINQKAE